MIVRGAALAPHFSLRPWGKAQSPLMPLSSAFSFALLTLRAAPGALGKALALSVGRRGARISAKVSPRWGGGAARPA